MGSIDRSVIEEARAWNDAGELERAYQVLADAGDSYSTWAAGIVGNGVGFQADVLQGAVRALWESQVPGSTQHFDQVAVQHQSNYIAILEDEQGRLPTTYEIENSYVNALSDFELPASLAIDVVINSAPNGIGATVWWLFVDGTDFDGAEWYEALGLEAERITPDQALVVEGMSPDQAYSLFFASVFEGLGGGPTESRYMALTIRDAARVFSQNNSLNLNVDDSSFLANIERFIENSKASGLWNDNTGASIIEALQLMAGSDLNYQSDLGLTLFESILAAAINGNAAQFEVYEEILASDRMCFGAEVLIDMWPLDPEFAPDPKNSHKQYDQNEIRATVWQKPIEQIEVGDIVASFDHSGNLVPRPVTRLFRNDAKILLNFHGTRVTPGHVYYRADGQKPAKFETLIDVLRDDGVIQRQDGSLIRAATNVPLGDPLDGFVQAVTGQRNPDGSTAVVDRGRLRLGTRFVVDGRRSYAIADLIKAGGGVVGEDELIRVGDGAPMAFHWEFSDSLPKPEDYVLACSATTLEAIYKASEWESQQPALPAPLVRDGGPVQPLSEAARAVMPRNEPLVLQDAEADRDVKEFGA